MRISFILPGLIRIPVGGIKVIHEYANRLSQRGHKINLLYPIELSTNYLYRFKKRLIRLYDQLNSVSQELYYTPDPGVNVHVIQRIDTKYIPEADIVLAQGWQTADQVARLPEKHGRKFYFLQSFETYFPHPGKIRATYRLPMKKIAISQWIIEALNQMGITAEGPLGNAINPKEFYPINPNQAREYDVLMMYHPQKIKGAADGIKILTDLKKRFPKLKALFVATRKPIHSIPAWIQTVIRPSIETLRTIYNSGSIFLHPSYWEGWPLPPMEAIACGCAVVAYRNRGVSEYLEHECNALLGAVGDRSQLVAHVSKLLQDPTRRRQLVEEAQKTVAQFSWDNIVTKFEGIISKQ